jgi:EAL domain-containing protein (putative c-di-GMP-specific phosphodiesterase class I)
MEVHPRKRREPVSRDEDTPISVAVAARERETLTLVREAVARKSVLLAFQPVMAAAGGGRVAFYEGLIRVLDDTGRILPARDFMGIVETEETGRQIDCLALELGLAALAKAPEIRLSLNMSARSIGYARWLRTLDRGLAADPRLGERLILEITESSAMTVPDIVTAFMREQQRRGISFALDDFGAGMTSFRYLREFYFDMVKIDGQFVRGVHASADNQVLVAALVSIAQHFDMLTVAESVEGEADAAWLVANGVDCLQGYFYGAPSVTAPWRRAAERQRA